jgi:hypothetical protein
VLIDDGCAEHIPGCNMAFRREALDAVGGFDRRFRVAGDDVDICWKLQERGWTLGFSPAAVVWHSRRNSIKAYLRQQLNYGRAEADLEKKWPLKYNAVGHLSWLGRVYGPATPAGTHWLLRPGRIYQGMWGSAPFQRIYAGKRPALIDLLTVPEYYLLVLCVMAAALVNVLFPPRFVGAIAVALVVGLPLLQAAVTAGGVLRWSPLSRGQNGDQSACGLWPRLQAWGLIAFLHVAQPLARLRGRLERGLTPWRLPFRSGLRLNLCYGDQQWSETWRSAEDRLREIRDRFSERGAVVRSGGDFDWWDLEVRAGLFATIRIKLLCEEHGNGHQLVRISARPGPGRLVLIMGVLFFGAIFLHLIGGPLAAALLCSLPMTVVWSRAVYEWLVGMTFVIDVIENRHEVAAASQAGADDVDATEVIEAVRPVTVSAATDSRQQEIEDIVDKILNHSSRASRDEDDDESGIALKVVVDG